jgi:NADH-quinone oxidoreductase subunit N
MRNLYQLLAVIAAINAAVGAFYYLRAIGVMYLRTPLRPVTGSRALPTLLASVVLAGATLFFGVYPDPLEKAARKAAPVPQIPTKATAQTH